MLGIYRSAVFSTAAGLALAPGATITVKRESDAGLATIFTDEAGTVPKANPFTADPVTGAFEFYALGISRGYWVRSQYGAEIVDARNQASGTASQYDATPYFGTVMGSTDSPSARNALAGAVSSRAANAILTVADTGIVMRATAAFTQTLTAAASLGNGWWVDLVNDSAGALIVDPNGAETIDGYSALGLAPGERARIVCNGAGFHTIGRVMLGVVSRRQTVRLSRVDSSGAPNFQFAGAALNFNTHASTVPLVIDFANGMGDLTAVLVADSTNQGALAASSTNYIHATYVDGGTVTWGNCLVPWQQGPAFDRTQAALLNFEAADATTTMLDDFGNTWTAGGNAQIDTAQFKFGTASLLLDGNGDYIDSTDITSLGDGSWEMVAWFRLAAVPTAGNNFHFFTARNASAFGAALVLQESAGTVKFNVYLSSNGTTHDISNAGAGTNTVWTLNQWNRVRFVFDALAGTYRVYLSLNGAAETQDFTVSSSARVCTVTSLRIGAPNSAAGATNCFNGWIDALRSLRCATKTSTETPVAAAPAIGDVPVHWFSTVEWKMYEVTGASTSAATNPLMTQRLRVFTSEQDTNATVITASRPYALQGKYTSAQGAFPGASSSISLNHNLGVKPKSRQLVAVNVTGENGFVPGDEITIFGGTNATYGMPVTIRANRTTASFATNLTNALVTNPKGGGDVIAMTPSKWNYRLELDRGY